MQNLNLKLKLSTKCLISLQEILSEPYSPIIRDATLFRFKRSVEIFWRLMKDYFFVNEGFVCKSPKSCMKMAFKVGLMDEEETVKALEMIDLRLKSEHVLGRRFRRNLSPNKGLLETDGRGLQADSSKN